MRINNLRFMSLQIVWFLMIFVKIDKKIEFNRFFEENLGKFHKFKAKHVLLAI